MGRGKALGQIMLYVDGMNGVINHNETIQWLYTLIGSKAPDAQAQQLWLTGPAAPRHVGSSQTRARTRVPCIGRQIFNHCATREAPGFSFDEDFSEPKEQEP
ncbi:hypothetical protein J1605_017981 [Eschrichtius robustus]|uniref:FHOD1/3-like FH3 domain-containing protein n=1 Tax=Eschrichtius robustus TaxID=9764 RepID=A0AB34HYV5_ESCRO|nr:hypothetical protein J1605_017981 [Eschrichtius robustus]